MAYLLFILVNATFFIRPAEIVPALMGLPIYEMLMIACLIAAHSNVFEQLRPRLALSRPITMCVLALLPAVMLSHLAQFSGVSLWYARHYGIEFLKVVLYYLLVVGLISSVARLRSFLYWIVLFTVVLTLLAVLQYHNLINIPALAALNRTEFISNMGGVVQFKQIRSTGLFNDPNDLSLILVVAMAITMYLLSDYRSNLLRLAWLAPLGLFGYAFALTRSRGGFLALLGGVLCLIQGRYGWKRTLPVALVTVPALFVLFSGRQTDISTNVGTAQSRMQIWSEGLYLFRHAPLFGIGISQYAEEVGHVAHNSFIHCFTELGFVGGSLFLGAFYFSVIAMYQVGSSGTIMLDREMTRLRPYLMAMLVAYATGLLSLSRSYIVLTYMVLGLASVYLHLARHYAYTPLPERQFDFKLLRQFAVVSVAFVMASYFFVRIFVRWG